MISEFAECDLLSGIDRVIGRDYIGELHKLLTPPVKALKAPQVALCEIWIYD